MNGVWLALVAFTICLILLIFSLFKEKNLNQEKQQELELKNDNEDNNITNQLQKIITLSKSIENSNNLQEIKEKASNIISTSNLLLKSLDSINNDLTTNTLYNPQKIFSELITELSPKIKAKNLEFTYNITTDLPKLLYGDYTNLKIIIHNILDNAYKYTTVGFVHLEVSCVNSKDNCKLIISIEDSGTGIDKNNVNNLFTNKSTTSETSSLILTKQLIEKMNGRILVHTIAQEGSKFTIIIDQPISSNNELAVNTNEDNNNFKDSNFAGMKIIIVDDDDMNLKIIKKLLERFSVNNCLFLNSGLALLDKINNNLNCDVIFLDLMMPNMDGVATLTKLKEIPNFNIPVVALTANNIDKNNYLENGFYDFLTKPIQKEDLLKILEKIKNINAKLPSKNVKKEIVSKEAEEILEEETDSPKSSESTALEYLESKGVDVKKALELLGDIEMYNETIKDFLNEVEEKWKRIVKNKLEGNMEDYAIDVHSLKSDCKYLGFMKLADISYQHELGSKAKDINFVNNNFQSLEEEFTKVLNIAKDYVARYIN